MSDDLPVLSYTIGPSKFDVTIRNSTEFLLGNLEAIYNNSVIGHYDKQYHPTYTISGIEYTDVLDADATASTYVAEHLSSHPDDVAWVRVVIAKNIGLIQDESFNGEIYTHQRE